MNQKHGENLSTHYPDYFNLDNQGCKPLSSLASFQLMSLMRSQRNARKQVREKESRNHTRKISLT